MTWPYRTVSNNHRASYPAIRAEVDEYQKERRDKLSENRVLDGAKTGEPVESSATHLNQQHKIPKSILKKQLKIKCMHLKSEWLKSVAHKHKQPYHFIDAVGQKYPNGHPDTLAKITPIGIEFYQHKLHLFTVIMPLLDCTARATFAKLILEKVYMNW
ncbi:hypothetical protein BJV82DRAFT_573493 [Fennellomyces sp. T-0311]|nr:hypothetical protein BJV82DRAFT_573493 [Fennellomyces sp. T-0311]